MTFVNVLAIGVNGIGEHSWLTLLRLPYIGELIVSDGKTFRVTHVIHEDRHGACVNVRPVTVDETNVSWFPYSGELSGNEKSRLDAGKGT